jgi:hypothetical protein
MRVSCRTSFSHATLSGIDSGHVFVPRANCCLIFELGCISDLSPKEVIQSHLVNTPECKSGEFALVSAGSGQTIQCPVLEFVLERLSSVAKWVERSVVNEIGVTAMRNRRRSLALSFGQLTSRT